MSLKGEPVADETQTAIVQNCRAIRNLLATEGYDPEAHGGMPLSHKAASVAFLANILSDFDDQDAASVQDILGASEKALQAIVLEISFVLSQNVPGPIADLLSVRFLTSASARFEHLSKSLAESIAAAQKADTDEDTPEPAGAIN